MDRARLRSRARRYDDAAALTHAFEGADGVFILPPSEFDPAPGFPEARAVIDAVKTALEAARPGKVVCLSTIGAQATQSNLLTQRTLMEQRFAGLPMPVTFLRPAWFMENAAWDVAPARDAGVIASFLQPLDKAVPMVATADIGRVAARLLMEDLERPSRRRTGRAAARDARTNSPRRSREILGRPVRAEAVERETWGALFRSQGTKDPMPRIQMLDGFNEGWIAFEHDAADIVKGDIGLESVLRGLVQRAQ